MKVKKLLILALTLVLVCSFGACQKEVTVDMAKLQSDLEAAKLFSCDFQELSTAKMKSVIGLDTELFSEGRGQFFVTSELTGEEYGLFVCNTKDDAAKLVDQLKAHNADYIEQYESYAPDAVPRLKNAVIKQSGIYVAYVCADKYDEAAKIVEEAFK